MRTPLSLRVSATSWCLAKVDIPKVIARARSDVGVKKISEIINTVWYKLLSAADTFHRSNRCKADVRAR